MMLPFSAVFVVAFTTHIKHPATTHRIVAFFTCNNYQYHVSKNGAITVKGDRTDDSEGSKKGQDSNRSNDNNIPRRNPAPLFKSSTLPTASNTATPVTSL
jgi:hypothetical protein